MEKSESALIQIINDIISDIRQENLRKGINCQIYIPKCTWKINSKSVQTASRHKKRIYRD